MSEQEIKIGEADESFKPVTITPTLNLRWSANIYYDASLDRHSRDLQQMWRGEDGSETWITILIEEEPKTK